MRILLTANASYLPPRGATRSNLLWLEHLAGAGHECRVVASSLAGRAEKRDQIREDGMHREWGPLWSVAERSRRLAVLPEQVRKLLAKEGDRACESC
jgi:hypothetical protein